MFNKPRLALFFSGLLVSMLICDAAKAQLLVPTPLMGEAVGKDDKKSLRTTPEQESNHENLE